MIEVVDGGRKLHVGEDIAFDLWRRNVRTLCGRTIGNAPRAKPGSKDPCCICKRVLAALLPDVREQREAS